VDNEPISYYLLFHFFGRIAFQPEDVFFDLGCGDGRVICFIARKHVSKVVGIELSRVFSDKARLNAGRLRGRRSPIEVRCGDAVEQDYTEGTVFFLFNPFGPRTLEAVLKQVQQSLASHPRSLSFLYFNPVHSHVFRGSGWLHAAGTRQGIRTKQRMELWTYEGERRDLGPSD